MDGKKARGLHAVTGLMFLAAVLFYIFFQINKREPFRDINPFGVDPYDAVGSFAIQAAFLVGILTYARAFRGLEDPSQLNGKSRLILRGCAFTLVAVAVTLAADAAAGWSIPSESMN